VEETEGGEEDEGGEPGGEEIARAEEPVVKELDKGDAGERGAEAGSELGYTEELVEEGGDPEGEWRLFEPEAGVPVQDEPAGGIKVLGGEDLAGNLGVDAFVPVGEAVVAKEGEDDDGGKEDGESDGGHGLAEGERAVGLVLRGRFRGHETNIREVLRARRGAARTAGVAIVPGRAAHGAIGGRDVRWGKRMGR